MCIIIIPIIFQEQCNPNQYSTEETKLHLAAFTISWSMTNIQNEKWIIQHQAPSKLVKAILNQKSTHIYEKIRKYIELN